MGRSTRNVPFIRPVVGIILLSLLAGALLRQGTPLQAASSADCRPDGMYQTPNAATPYCGVYDSYGREKMGADHPRRIIGYFPSWRTGKDGQPAYLVNNIPWSKVTHINYAFAHIDSSHKISVGNPGPTNASLGMTWPGVAMDPNLPYQGHFNLLTQFKRQYPNVKTIISVGGWAETGGFFAEDGSRVNDGGFYTLASNPASINTFADSVVAFLRTYGFDGVDIDYEYPTSMKDAGNPLDWQFANPQRATLMQGYALLMQTLREKLDAAAAADGHYYMLTIAAPSSAYLLRGMETYQVTQYLDYVNLMSYDLHGAWNEFVGPNAALYDDGKDAELARWGVYTTAQYGGLGYLNSDWAYHYFRGAMQPGRINMGVPYYTRGWKNVTGGTNGLWGTAPGSGCPTGLTTCGDGARGIDNVWHDSDEQGNEIGAGTNPMWHAKNLEHNIYPSYAAQLGLSPSDPEDQLVGTYVRNYNSTLVAPWLWNAQKRVFLSTEDEQSLGVKADYVVNNGLGGVMFWELSGDYGWDSTHSEYFMGSTLTTKLYDIFKTAVPYGNTRANRPMPTNLLNVAVRYTSWAVGDNNYPINPKMVITNSSTQTIPGGAVFEFDYGTSAPNNAKDQSGWGLAVVQSGHSGPNVGGLKGDFQHVRFTTPAWQSIAPGSSVTIDYVYYLPVTTPSNWTISFGGSSYSLSSEYPRGSLPNATPTPATVSPTLAATNTPVGTPALTPTPHPTGTGVPPTATPRPTNTAVPPTATPGSSCSNPAWERTKVYLNNDRVSHAGHAWRAKWWTQGDEPGVSTSGVWEDSGPCGSGSPTPQSTKTPAPTGTAGPTVTPPPTATRTPGATATPQPTATRTPGATATLPGVAAWQPGVAYTPGTLVSYGGSIYSCRQTHTSQIGWEPPAVLALWMPQ